MHHDTQQQVEHKGAAIAFNQNQFHDIQKHVDAQQQGDQQAIDIKNTALKQKESQFSDESQQHLHEGASQAERGTTTQAVVNTVTYFENKDIKVPEEDKS